MNNNIERYREKSRLKSSGFFYETLREESLPARTKGPAGPLVGYFCNLVPEEIILASGAVPVRLCSEDLACCQKGEEIIPGDICPLIKSICGSLGKEKPKEIDLIVIPAACDGKMKLAEILGFKDVYFLDMPRDSDYLKNAGIWTDKYTQFYEFLKERYNRKTRRKELLRASQILNQRTIAFRKIYHERAQNPGLINAFDYLVMSYTSFFMDPSVWVEKAEKLYEEGQEIKSKTPAVFKGKRLLLAGAPVIFPNFKILEILAEIGCEMAADTLCSSYGRLYTPVEIDEETESGILRALSLKYIAASLCPCFLGVNKLIDLIVDMVRKYHLDGVIYHNLRLCQVYEIQIPVLRQKLKDNKIPFLSIKTDLGKEDIGQIKTRIEAYLEILR